MGKPRAYDEGKHIMSDYDYIGYSDLIENAMLSVAKQSLKFVQHNGLPGEHHFYITFLTHADGVDIPDFLRKNHPHDMTIVLQNQFWNLGVEDDHMHVDLSFNQTPYTLRIPFTAFVSFHDPSVQFSLHFNMTMQDEDDLPDHDKSLTERDTPNQKADVIRLDDFRKNKNKETPKP